MAISVASGGRQLLERASAPSRRRRGRQLFERASAPSRPERRAPGDRRDGV